MAIGSGPFGFFRREKPLALVPFAEAKPRSFGGLLCDGVVVLNPGSFAALLEVQARLQAERPDMRVLLTLNDRAQAEYTSGHAVDTHDLDVVAGEAFSDRPPEFAVRLANLRAKAEGVGMPRGVLDWETSGDDNDPVTINRDPEAALRIDREKDSLAQFVPVNEAADALAAMPNGYFASDLDPMQSLALARHLEAEYGLGLFGIGASVLGFRRAAVMDGAVAVRLARDVADFYAGAPSGAVEALAALLAGRDWLLLRYTES